MSMQTMPNQKDISIGFLWVVHHTTKKQYKYPLFQFNGSRHKRPEHRADKPFPFSSPSPSVPNIPEFLTQFRMDSNSLSNLLSERSKQEPRFFKQFLVVFGFSFSFLLGLVGLKYQNSDGALFHEHSVIMLVPTNPRINMASTFPNANGSPMLTPNEAETQMAEMA
nr:hypothetical protein CFP56_39600 [Quercus suber]